jgi:hypothetical protein
MKIKYMIFAILVFVSCCHNYVLATDDSIDVPVISLGEGDICAESDATEIPEPEEISRGYNPSDSNTYWTGADGRLIMLYNNESAADVTYQEVIDFILRDETDKHPYTLRYQCGDFAEDVHNNAESEGIRCGWVSLEGIDHACNVFDTTDLGRVFIDCTHGDGVGSWDAVVNVHAGEQYIPTSLISDGYTYESMGKVTGHRVYW